METKTLNSQKAKNSANYVLLFLSTLGIGYSVVKSIKMIENDHWYGSLPLLIISISIFLRNFFALRKK